MHIVCDTNVLARAARSGSLAAKVVARIIAGPDVLLLSPVMLSEVARVLRYPRMLAMHGLDDAAIDAFVLHLQTAALVIALDPGDIVPVVLKDSDDDVVIATAVVGHADILCTRDTHFADSAVEAYCRQHGIRIMDDLALLQMLGGPPGP